MVGAGGLTSSDDAALLSADALFIISKRAVGAADADGAGRLDGQRLAGRLAAGYLAGGGRDAVWRRMGMANFTRLCGAGSGLAEAPATGTFAAGAVLRSAAAAGRRRACRNERWLAGDSAATNHALHLFCVASWFGGLLPFIYCLRLRTVVGGRRPSAP